MSTKTIVIIVVVAALAYLVGVKYPSTGQSALTAAGLGS